MGFCEWSLTIGDTRHVFGKVEVTSWSIGGREYRTDDTDRPRSDGIFFGQDFANPGDVEIDLIIRAEGTGRQTRFEEAMEIRREFNRFWNGDEIRLVPGATSDLEIAGIAIVEGRPRHVDWDDSRATFGIIRGKALFVRGFDHSFEPGASWNEIEVGHIPVQQGGLVAPLIAPLSTTRVSSRARPFTVDSDEPVWPIITIKGPISNAKVELTHGWTIHLNRSLAYDDVVVIDSRPGRRTMTLNGLPRNVLSPAGARLSQLSISPGIQEVALRGTTLEGTASVKVRWRNVKKVL